MNDKSVFRLVMAISVVVFVAVIILNKKILPVPETIPAESSTGPVTMKIGYRFKSDDIIVTLKADSLVLSNEVLTHKLAQRLMKEQPHDFRAYIKRGYYEANSNYFK